MLDEGQRRRERGTDVVVAFVDTHGRPRTEALTQRLEVVPAHRRVIGTEVVEQLDLPAVLARRPAVALVDDLARPNTPGTPHRWCFEDVEELLAAGIDVVTTVDISQIDSVRDVVERILGDTSSCVVPDSLVRGAEQVELIDMTPQALRRRVTHGNVVAPERIDAALVSSHREDTLTALRELALLWVADQVEERLHHGPDAAPFRAHRETRERIVVALTGAPSGAHLIRRASRLAQRSSSELIGVHVRGVGQELADEERDRLEQHRVLLSSFGGSLHEVVDADPAQALVEFARGRHATQIVMGTSHRSRWVEFRSGSIVSRVLRSAREIDVHVISDDEHAPPRPGSRRHPMLLPLRRRILGLFVGLVGIVLLTSVLAGIHPATSLSTDLLLFLLVVLAVALIAGVVAGVVTALVSFLAATWFLTPPLHTFTVAVGQDLVALITFFIVSLVMSLLVSQLARRSGDAERSRMEAEGLARAAASLVGSEQAVSEILAVLRRSFDRRGVVLVLPSDDGWQIDAQAGDAIDITDRRLPEISIPGGGRLIHDGPPLSADDDRVLHAFCATLGTALERRRLQREAAEAAAAAQGDQLRTAILRAVSHDLRTPLSSIKASASSLLQTDVDWPPEAQREFLLTIDEEADRLNTVVGNLLDMSRLEAGVVRPARDLVDLAETVWSSLSSLSESTSTVEVAIADGLPPVVADQALLQQAVANLVANALRHGSSSDGGVLLLARRVGATVELRVVDHGPGLRPHDRERLFEPFQRLGDRAGGAGVGLGLAVARGFIEAMAGSLHLEDTDGGGLTAVVVMPAGDHPSMED